MIAVTICIRCQENALGSSIVRWAVSHIHHTRYTSTLTSHTHREFWSVGTDVCGPLVFSVGGELPGLSVVYLGWA